MTVETRRPPADTQPEGGAPLAFLFTDIEGSTRLLEALGEAYGPVLLEHRRLVREALEANAGDEQGTEGDSFFAVFASAAQAVNAAAAIQVALDRHDWGDQPVRVRIGIHAGRAARIGESYVGLDIHRAARVMAAAHGGQVLLSDAARLAAEPLAAGLELRDLGRHRLKDVGAERLWQLAGPGLPEGPFGALRSLEAHPTNLPGELTPIFGREADAEHVAGLVRSTAVTTVTGPGGIGKSRLAVHVGHRLLETFPDGIFYVDLGTTDRVELAIEQVLAVLGLRPDDGDPATALLDHLRGRDLLIVLDTVDRLVAFAAVLADVAASCPRVRFLVTARSPLHLAIEREYPLAPLPTSAMVELFLDRARAVRPGFSADAATRNVIADIGERLDGLPLAIELAAARTRLFPPSALRERLSRRLPLLTGGPLYRPDRQRTLHDTIAWSYDLLAPVERDVFERLGVFAGTFDLEGLEAVSGGGADPDATLTALEQLVDRSLVARSPGDDGRFRLLATIREFALDALRVGGHEVAARDAHARHALALARRALSSLGGPDDLEAIAAIERDDPDLRAALEWLVEPAARERARLGLELAAVLGRFWWLRGRIREGSAWLERALALAPEADPAARATALFWSGVLFDDLRQPEPAAERLDACLALRRELDDPAGLARALNSRGAVARSLGDLDRAEELIGESLRRSRDAGDRSATASATSNLAIVAYERGDLDRAIALFADTRTLDAQGGARGAIASSTLNLATVLIEAGRGTEGLDAIRGVVPDLDDIGDPELVIGALEAVADAAASEARAAEGARLLYAAAALRAREHLAPRPSEQAAIDRIERRVMEDVDEEARRAASHDSASVDMPAAIAMLSVALGLPVSIEPLHGVA